MHLQVQHLHCPQLTSVNRKRIQVKPVASPPQQVFLEEFSFIDTTNENE